MNGESTQRSLSEWSELEFKMRAAEREGDRLKAAADYIRERIRNVPDLTPDEIADELVMAAGGRYSEFRRIEDLLSQSPYVESWTAEEREALELARTQDGWDCSGNTYDAYVWLEGEPGSAEIAVVFKHRDHPGRMFGSRGWRVSDMTDYAEPHPSTTIMWANITETIEAADLGLPTDAKPGEVTWI